MPRLVYSKHFAKSLRDFLRKHPDLEVSTRERLFILQNNPKDRRLKIHKLTGKLKGLLGASLTYEYRLIFYWEDHAIFLVAIGTHDEVY